MLVVENTGKGGEGKRKGERRRGLSALQVLTGWIYFCCGEYRDRGGICSYVYRVRYR